MIRIVNGGIKNGRIPVNIRGEYHMGKGIPFKVGVRAHGNIGEARFDVERNAESIRGSNALFTPWNLESLVIDIITKGFKLPTGVYGFTMANRGILMEDENNETTLGANYSTSSDKRDIGELMIINTLDVDGTRSTTDDANIIAANATISTTVNKGAKTRTGAGMATYGKGSINLAEKFTINGEFRGGGRRGRRDRRRGVGRREEAMEVSRWKWFTLCDMGQDG